MIFYPGAKFHPNLLFKSEGSVMPFSCLVALPCALLSAAAKTLSRHFLRGDDWAQLGLDRGTDSVAQAAFGGLSFLIGFLIVFRAQQAYSRFWEGCHAIHAMQGEWFDAASSLVAFSRGAKTSHKNIVAFHHTLVRLMSLLNSSVLMELCVGVDREDQDRIDTSERAFELELVDAEGLNMQSLRTFNEATVKVELVFQWVQQLVVESNNRDIFGVAPPILSRSFQELSNGMVWYRQASKIARIPLPFPYVQATELLLVSHWLLMPALMSMWTGSSMWAAVLSFVQVTFFWSLNSIATELENPFGEDVNDLPAAEIQHDFNKRLLLLVQPQTQATPKLSHKTLKEITESYNPRRLKLSTSGILRPDSPAKDDPMLFNGSLGRSGSLGGLSIAVKENLLSISRSIDSSSSGSSSIHAIKPTPETYPNDIEAKVFPFDHNDTFATPEGDDADKDHSMSNGPDQSNQDRSDTSIRALLQVCEDIRDEIKNMMRSAATSTDAAPNSSEATLHHSEGRRLPLCCIGLTAEADKGNPWAKQRVRG